MKARYTWEGGGSAIRVCWHERATVERTKGTLCNNSRLTLAFFPVTRVLRCQRLTLVLLLTL